MEGQEISYLSIPSVRRCPVGRKNIALVKIVYKNYLGTKDTILLNQINSELRIPFGVTIWLDYLFTVLPFRAIKIRPIA